MVAGIPASSESPDEQAVGTTTRIAAMPTAIMPGVSGLGMLRSLRVAREDDCEVYGEPRGLTSDLAW
ncbi:hypothetical protein BJF87_02450 [Gordonia sp. CNJ-863]|nr:hypothetical protein BJF87_02450 [Gordonia sp. CNJ-863]